MVSVFTLYSQTTLFIRKLKLPKLSLIIKGFIELAQLINNNNKTVILYNFIYVAGKRQINIRTKSNYEKEKQCYIE